MIIGISGKIGSGKDTIGKIIQYLTSESSNKTSSKYRPFSVFLLKGGGNQLRNFDHHYYSDVEIKKFADKLKDIVCLLIGCTREQLENHEFKNTELGEEWTTYAYADGFSHNYLYKDGKETKTTIMNAVPCSREKFLEEYNVNWQTAYKRTMTPRLLLQLIGTECGRNIIHPNVWVNSLMSEYKSNLCNDGRFVTQTKEDGSTLSWIPNPLLEPNTYPNWIITDMRFPNELEAVKSREGISIRVERNDGTRAIDVNPHPSETALDNAEFDYTIENKGTIEELIEKVKEILIKEKIINEVER